MPPPGGGCCAAHRAAAIAALPGDLPAWQGDPWSEGVHYCWTVSAAAGALQHGQCSPPLQSGVRRRPPRAHAGPVLHEPLREPRALQPVHQVLCVGGARALEHRCSSIAPRRSVPFRQRTDHAPRRGGGAAQCAGDRRRRDAGAPGENKHCGWSVDARGCVVASRCGRGFTKPGVCTICSTRSRAGPPAPPDPKPREARAYCWCSCSTLVVSLPCPSISILSANRLRKP
jgi:hypothetical protein